MMTEQEKRSMDIKDVASDIRLQLKKEFPYCKFSITIERYSMGQSMTIALMEAPFTGVIAKREGEYVGGVMVSSMVGEFDQYAQINKYTLSKTTDEYEKDKIVNNGSFISKEARNCLKRAYELSLEYNYNNSDTMTDYFDVNFYLSLAIGKYNKPFKNTGIKCCICSKYFPKKETEVCSVCGKSACLRDSGSAYVDGNNKSITKYAPTVCRNCYRG